MARRPHPVLLATLLAALPGCVGQGGVQTVDAPAEQQIEILHSEASEQAIHEVNRDGQQQVGRPVPRTSGQRAARATSKVVVGVTAVAVAIGTAIAFLLFV